MECIRFKADPSMVICIVSERAENESENFHSSLWMLLLADFSL